MVNFWMVFQRCRGCCRWLRLHLCSCWIGLGFRGSNPLSQLLQQRLPKTLPDDANGFRYTPSHQRFDSAIVATHHT